MVLRLVERLPAPDRKYARWMRSDLRGRDFDVIVFAAKPLVVRNGGYSPWVAVNSNEFINPYMCEGGALPSL